MCWLGSWILTTLSHVVITNTDQINYQVTSLSLFHHFFSDSDMMIQVHATLNYLCVDESNIVLFKRNQFIWFTVGINYLIWWKKLVSFPPWNRIVIIFHYYLMIWYFIFSSEIYFLAQSWGRVIFSCWCNSSPGSVDRNKDKI